MKLAVDGASVKIMRSYDYCHFEVTLSVNDGIHLDNVDLMRKEAMRLVDQAVEQYKIARSVASRACSSREQLVYLRDRASVIHNIPASEWTGEQQAIVKMWKDHEFYAHRQYDYQDDWDLDDDRILEDES